MTIGKQEFAKKSKCEENLLCTLCDQTWIGLFEMDLELKRLYPVADGTKKRRREEIAEIFPESLIEKGLIHPDFIESFRGMYERLFHGAEHVECTIKICTVAGGYRWVRVTCNVMNQSKLAVFTSEDIHDMMIVQSLYKQEEQYRAILTADAKTTFEFDLTADGLLKWDDRVLKMVGLTHSCSYTTFVEKIIEKAVHPDYQQQMSAFARRERIIQSFHQGQVELEMEYISKDYARNWVWDKLVLYLIQSTENEHIYGFLYVKNIDKKKRYELALKEKAERDALTCLYNRDTLEDLINMTLEHDREGGLCSAFLMLDLDEFKQVNDIFGHVCGDQVLVEIAQRLRSFFGAMSFVGRLGGDEFGIFLSHIESEAWLQEKVTELCKSLYLCHVLKDKSYYISGSIGIAIAPEHGNDFHTLYQRADEAQYQAKRSGKNQYLVYGKSASEFQTPEWMNPEWLIDAMDSGIYVSDIKTYEILYVNRIIRSATGLGERDYQGKKCYELLLGRLTPCPFCNVAQIRADEFYEREFIEPSSNRHYLLRGKQVKWNGILAHIEFVVDLTKKYHTQKTEERYSAMQKQTNTVLIEHNLKTGEWYYSENIAELLAGDYSNGRNLFTIWEEADVVYQEDKLALEKYAKEMMCPSDEKRKELALRLKGKQGVWQWHKLISTEVQEQNEQSTCVVMTINNAHGEISSQRFLHYKAEYDELTGIYNRKNFYYQTQCMLKDNAQEKYILVRWDIERFKVVNDLFSIQEGDKLLRYIASEMQQIVEEVVPRSQRGRAVTYGRLDADHFAFCVPHGLEMERKIIKRLGQSLKRYPLQFEIVPTFGLYLIDNKNIPIELMSDRAKMALQTIKGNYMHRYAFYDENLRKNILEEQKIVNDMRKSLEAEEFSLYVQPKYHLATGKIWGAEVLIRWFHPTKGQIYPNVFIPIFEKNGFIMNLDYYVWEHACALLRRWQDEGRCVLPIAINISRINLYNPKLGHDLIALVEKYQLSPNLLELEITESAYTENPKQLLDMMKIVQSYGFRVSMDDFGSGYSSLNMLKDLPVDILKIDMKFLSNFDNSEKSKAILASIVDMAKKLNMIVIAEGVETKQQADFLQSISCDGVQGYYFSKPIPIVAYEKMIP